MFFREKHDVVNVPTVGFTARLIRTMQKVYGLLFLVVLILLFAWESIFPQSMHTMLIKSLLAVYFATLISGYMLLLLCLKRSR